MYALNYVFGGMTRTVAVVLIFFKTVTVDIKYNKSACARWYPYLFQKFNPSPAPQRRKKTICMGFTLKLPQKLSLDFTFKA
jgi:hypothetical protein